jgi:glycosyltransferase involved in cell wall biosynthesis
MKILLITNSYLPQLGGLEIAVSNLARHIAKKGHRVAVISGANNLSINSSEDHSFTVYRMPFVLPRIIFGLGWKRFWQSFLMTLLFPLLFPLALFNMLEIYKKFKPDIVNLHYIGYNSLYVLILKRIFKFPLVVNIHGNDIGRVNERSSLAKYLTRTTLRNSDLVLSNSYHLLREAEKVNPGIRDKSRRVGNGIDLRMFMNVPPYSYHGRYILNIANFDPKKGQDILIRGFARARDLCQHELPVLLLAGDGPNLRRCKKLTQELSLNGRVEFLGRVAHKDVPSLLKGCNFFVHPARKEAFGIVILEAMASAKAVVATSVGGVSELVRDTENGILVQQDSPEELAKGIIKLVKNQSLTKKLGRRGKEIVREYTWEKIVDRYIESYLSVLKKRQKDKYNVLFITSRLDIGGEELSTLSLAKEFKRRGHNVCVLSTMGPLLNEYLAHSVNVALGPVGGRKVWNILRGAIYIRRFVRRNSIQIIHSQSVIPALESYLASMTIFRNRPVLIWHDRGIRERNYPIVGRLFNFMADFVITNSDYERKKLLAHGMSPRKMRRIHNCFNLIFPENKQKDTGLLDELHIKCGEIIIGSARRLHPEKGGHYTFLEAAREVVEVFPEGIKLLVVGDGALRSSLERFCQKLGIEKKVIFAGARRDIERFYSIMDIFVLPSTWEPFGNALVEAMAYGIPCVATKVGGIPEIVIDGETGILVPAENPRKLAEAIIYLLQNPDLAKRMGEAGRKRAKNYFTSERLAREIEEIYFSLCRG